MAFIIYENEQFMDGEVYHTKEALFRAIGFADHSAKVFEFDIAEAFRDGATSFLDVTEDMVHEAYRNGDIDAETQSHGIAGMFIDFPMSADEAARTRADAWHDEMVGA